MDVNQRVIFFGDSICVGQGVSIHRGWVARLAAQIETLAARFDRKLIVVNASVNGNTTRQALERMPYDIQSHGVGVLLVQFGLNDCNCWMTDRGLPRVSPAAFAANLEEIIQRGVAFGARKILLNTNHPTARDQEPMSGTGKTYEESNRDYNALIRDVAARFPGTVLLNDVERDFMEECANGTRLKDLLLEDDLHISEKGHDLYFRKISPQISSVIEEIYDV